VERIREATNGNYALGDRRFQAEIEQALGRRVTKGKAGRPKAQPEHRRGQLGLLWNRGLSPITLPYYSPIALSLRLLNFRYKDISLLPPASPALLRCIRSSLTCQEQPRGGHMRLWRTAVAFRWWLFRPPRMFAKGA
jgi:hypothetical protein